MDVLHDITDGKTAQSPDGKPTPGDVKLFDIEKLLSISMIRTHTKTDDVPNVTDEQIRLYRRGAFESALHYTGLLLGPVQMVTEEINYSYPRIRNGYPTRQHASAILKYPVVGKQVFPFSGGQPLPIKEGSRKIRLDIGIEALQDLLAPCCSPCSGAGGRDGQTMSVMYRAGYSCEEDVPAGVLVGMLKWIAWSIARPGDELLTIRNRQSTDTSGLQGTNNVAWASGALEMWREYDDQDF